MEIWKDIENYEGIYQISSLGRVRSLERIANGSCRNGGKYTVKGRVLKNSTGGENNNREYIHIRVNGEKRSFSIPRLVAIAFIPNLENKPEVNHIDGNTLNNRVENLEWVTKSENEIHAYKLNLKKPSNKGRTLEKSYLAKPVIQFDKNMKQIKRYSCAKQAMIETGIRNQKICDCLKGRNKTAGGYIWKYE